MLAQRVHKGRVLLRLLVAACTQARHASDVTLADNVNAKRLALAKYYGRSSVSGIQATVFGSTGLLGRPVVPELAKIGSRVVVPYRHQPREVGHLKMSGDLGQVRPIKFDVRDMESLRTCVRDSNVVINLIGAEVGTRNFSLHDIHVNIPKAIATAAKAEGVDQIIHVSMMGADENAESEVLQTKAEGEAAVREIYPDAVVVRPNTLFGEVDRLYFRIAMKIRLYNHIPFYPMFNIERKFAPVWNVDVARAIAQCAQNMPETAGKTYDLAGPTTMTTRELWKQIAEALEVRFEYKELPFEMIKPFYSVWGGLPKSWQIYNYDELVRQKADQLPSDDVLGFNDLNLVPLEPEKKLAEMIEPHRRRWEWGFESSIDRLYQEGDRRDGSSVW